MIPYPFTIGDDDFSFKGGRGDYGRFFIKQSWLNGNVPNGGSIIQLVKHLYDEGNRILSCNSSDGSVDAIVFPEISMDSETYDSIKQNLLGTSEINDLIIIAGLTGRDGNRTENKVVIEMLASGK